MEYDYNLQADDQFSKLLAKQSCASHYLPKRNAIHMRKLDVNTS